MRWLILAANGILAAFVLWILFSPQPESKEIRKIKAIEHRLLVLEQNYIRIHSQAVLAKFPITERR